MRKRYIVWMLCAAFVLTAFTGCGNKDNEGQASEVAYTAGTYTGEGQGYGGKIVVEVDVDGSRILAVRVVENHETPGIADPALEQIPDKIVEQQSVEVDTIAGCTMASKGIVEAAGAALEQGRA